ncbi:hypothetical protein ACFE04_010469 [Oxalis oulophora]
MANMSSCSSPRRSSECRNNARSNSFRINDEATSPPNGKRKRQSEHVVKGHGLEPYLERLSNDVDTQIGFLTAIIDYHKCYEVFPYRKVRQFDRFIKQWLQVDVSQEDLLKEVDKFRQNYYETTVKMGNNMIFSRLCDQKLYNLAHQLWNNST